MELGFPMVDDPNMHEELIEDFDDAMVAGKMDSRNTFILISTVFILIDFLLL